MTASAGQLIWVSGYGFARVVFVRGDQVVAIRDSNQQPSGTVSPVSRQQQRDTERVQTDAKAK